MSTKDEVVQQAISRNRKEHELCKRVDRIHVSDEEVRKVVAFLEPDNEEVMTLHVPMNENVWLEEKDSIALVKGDPGRILTFNAANSANERPERIVSTKTLLEEEKNGLLKYCTRAEIIPASRDMLLLAHSQEHVDKMLRLEVSSNPTNADIIHASTRFNYVFMNEHSARAARYAAGAAVEAVRALLWGTAQSALAVTRPPGHHSESGCAMGFCIFNSIAVAAQAALRGLTAPSDNNVDDSTEQKTKKSARRVLIVDWDIHHGNGTQEIFAETDEVFYVSLHMYNTGWEYPMCVPRADPVSGAPEHIGENKGQGYTCNIAWNPGVYGVQGYGAPEYIEAFHRVIIPMAQEYEPDLILVSAGFDSGAGDECGYMVTPSAYGHLTQQLVEEIPSANGRVLVMLEGGYNIPAVAYGMEGCLAALLCPARHRKQASTKVCSAHAITDINQTVDAHKAHWRCFQDKNS